MERAPERRAELGADQLQVNGKQYIAVTVGNGGAQAATFPALVPEIKNPPDRGARSGCLSFRIAWCRTGHRPGKSTF